MNGAGAVLFRRNLGTDVGDVVGDIGATEGVGSIPSKAGDAFLFAVQALAVATKAWSMYPIVGTTEEVFRDHWGADLGGLL